MTIPKPVQYAVSDGTRNYVKTMMIHAAGVLKASDDPAGADILVAATKQLEAAAMPKCDPATAGETLMQAICLHRTTNVLRRAGVDALGKMGESATTLLDDLQVAKISEQVDPLPGSTKH